MNSCDKCHRCLTEWKGTSPNHTFCPTSELCEACKEKEKVKLEGMKEMLCLLRSIANSLDILANKP